MKDTLSQKLKEARSRTGLSKREFAKLTGVTQKELDTVEKGKKRNSNPLVLLFLSDVLGESYIDLLSTTVWKSCVDKIIKEYEQSKSTEHPKNVFTSNNQVIEKEEKNEIEEKVYNRMQEQDINFLKPAIEKTKQILTNNYQKDEIKIDSQTGRSYAEIVTKSVLNATFKKQLESINNQQGVNFIIKTIDDEVKTTIEIRIDLSSLFK